MGGGLGGTEGTGGLIRGVPIPSPTLSAKAILTTAASLNLPRLEATRHMTTIMAQVMLSSLCVLGARESF